jgi:hypothetical protein
MSNNSPQLISLYDRKPWSAVQEGTESSSTASDESKASMAGNPRSIRKVATTGNWVLSYTFDSVAIQIGRHVRFLELINDVRVRELQSKLISEQSRICSWARDRKISSITQVESMLHGFPVSPKAAISSLCDILKTWMQESVHTLEEYSNLAATASGPSREEKLNFIIEGYQLLEILRAVNNGLYTVASSLSNRNTNLDWEGTGNILTSVGSTLDDALSPNLFSSTTVLQELPGDMPVIDYRRADTIPYDIKTSTDAKADDTVPSFNGVPSSLRIFFTNLLDALQVVITQVAEKESPRRLHARLLVWGCGLFPASMNLDQILDPDHETHGGAAAGFRSHIVGTLADIGVILGNWDIHNHYMSLIVPRKSFEMLRS